MRIAARITFYVALTVAIVLVLWVFRQIIGLFIFSIALAAATRPLVEYFDLRRINRSLALILVYLAIIAFVVLIFAAIMESLLNEMQILSDNLAFTYERIWQTWPEGSDFQSAVAGRLPPPAELYRSIGGESGLNLVQGLLGFTVNSLTFLSQFFIVVVLSIYWSGDYVRFERLWLSLLPVESRAWARDVWRRVEAGVGAYVRNEFARALLAGVLLGIGFGLLGVPYPTLLAVLGAVLALFPWLGVLLMLAPVFLTGLAAGPLVAGAAVVYTLVVLLVIEVVIQPRIFKIQAYSTLLMVLLAYALAEVMGFAGILLAPPLTATIQLTFRYSTTQGGGRVSPQRVQAGSTEKLEAIRARLAGLHHEVDEAGDETSPQAASMLARVDELVEKTGDLVGDIEE